MHGRYHRDGHGRAQRAPRGGQAERRVAGQMRHDQGHAAVAIGHRAVRLPPARTVDGVLEQPDPDSGLGPAARGQPAGQDGVPARHDLGPCRRQDQVPRPGPAALAGARGGRGSRRPGRNRGGQARRAGRRRGGRRRGGQKRGPLPVGHADAAEHAVGDVLDGSGQGGGVRRGDPAGQHEHRGRGAHRDGKPVLARAAAAGPEHLQRGLPPGHLVRGSVRGQGPDQALERGIARLGQVRRIHAHCSTSSSARRRGSADSARRPRCRAMRTAPGDLPSIRATAAVSSPAMTRSATTSA